MTQNANALAHQAKSRSYLNVMQALLWVIFFLPFYLFAGLRLVFSARAIPDWWFLLSFISWTLFSKLTVYVLISLIVVISGIAAFMRGYQGRLARFCALLFALSVIALPWLMPYEPALDAAPGVTMHVVSPPLTPVASFVKMMNVLAQEVPCEHELLGWNDENELHYRRQCGAREYIWFVDPDQADTPVATAGFLNDMRPDVDSLRQEEALREQVLEIVRADHVRPESAEPSVREIMLREGSLRSPDGQWIAAISQHIYGPQDVMLISVENEAQNKAQNEADNQADNQAQKALGCAEGGMGVHTSEDVRCYLDQFPEEFVRHINDKVSVLFTNPDPNSTAELIGGALIYHIPSVSVVTLDFKGDVDLRYTKFEDLSALLAFERVLTNGVLMAEFKQNVQSLWKRDTTTDPDAEFELQVATIWENGHDVAFIALLRGGEADQDKFYCAGDHWVFGDDFSEDEIADCEPKENQPDNQPIQRVFLTRHIYETNGQYEVQVTVSSDETSVTSEPLNIWLP